MSKINEDSIETLKPERREIARSKDTAKPETAIVVGLVRRKQTREHAEEYLEELKRLADTAGAAVQHMILQERDRMDAATFIGSGKAREIGELVADENISMVIFDDDLSPVQIRNLEKHIKCKIIDRSGLILDIFAFRAKSKEAMTQVELAQLQYMLPRLTRQWTHLSKQFGGVGTKGPGETQIESDRRAIRKRISLLKEKLHGIELERNVQRNRRSDLVRVALVGYTNAGKSTLLKLFSNADVLVEDRLFATLDTTVRKVSLSSGKKILLSDTVGFIRKLPTTLVASFKSTLTEVIEADLLLHVVDVSHPQFTEHIEVVRQTLEELKVADKPTIFVFNKIDAVADRSAVQDITTRYNPSVIISAARNINVSGLVAMIENILNEDSIIEEITIPQSEYKTIARLHGEVEIINKTYEGNCVHIQYRVNINHRDRVKKLLGKKH
ncbi:MAG: GTPase HflX [Bacteroidota bacterium]